MSYSDLYMVGFGDALAGREPVHEDRAWDRASRTWYLGGYEAGSAALTVPGRVLPAVAADVRSAVDRAERTAAA